MSLPWTAWGSNSSWPWSFGNATHDCRGVWHVFQVVLLCTCEFCLRCPLLPGHPGLLGMSGITFVEAELTGNGGGSWREGSWRRRGGGGSTRCGSGRVWSWLSWNEGEIDSSSFRGSEIMDGLLQSTGIVGRVVHQHEAKVTRLVIVAGPASYLLPVHLHKFTPLHLSSSLLTGPRISLPYLPPLPP